MDAGQLKLVVQDPSARCFVEDDGRVSLIRRSLAEGVGSAMLLVAVIGSGLHEGASPLSSAMAVSGSLIGLIVAFGAVSGGHFNPTITLMQWLTGKRETLCTAAYVSAQITGAVIGSLIADITFSKAPSIPGSEFPSIPSLVSEGVASFSLMTIVFCCTRSASKLVGPFAVGMWLMAAILSTPTGSIANPAVAIALLAAPDSISLPALALFLVAQIVGGSLAVLTVSTIYPDGD